MPDNLKFGPLHFNGQAHWARNGQALFKLDRSFQTGDNIVVAFGPELVLEPCTIFSLSCVVESAGHPLHLSDRVKSARLALRPRRGRGYELQAWLDLAGWRPSISFWKGRHFLSQQGDPEFQASNFPEFGLSKTISLGVGLRSNLESKPAGSAPFLLEDGINYHKPRLL